MEREVMPALGFIKSVEGAQDTVKKPQDIMDT